MNKRNHLNINLNTVHLSTFTPKQVYSNQPSQFSSMEQHLKHLVGPLLYMTANFLCLLFVFLFVLLR